jgi:hypothetical protein
MRPADPAMTLTPSLAETRTAGLTRRAQPAIVDFVTSKTDWDALVTAAPFPHLPQSFAYGEGKAATGWLPKRAVFSIAGRQIAFATVLEKRVGGIRLVARVNRGPVFLDADPTADDVVAVHRALRRRWRGPLLIAPVLEAETGDYALMRAAGFRLRHTHGWQSGRIALERSADELWASYGSTFRNRTRNAEKAGATVDISQDADVYAWMLERHVENMQEKHFNAAPPALLTALRETDPESVSVFRVMLGGEPVAGMSVVRFGKGAEYHIGWFGHAGRQINAGNLLMWSIQKHLRETGAAWFDVGGLKPGDGYTQFKRTMRPMEYRLTGEWMSF